MFSLLISLFTQAIICNTHMVMFFAPITFCSLANACVIGISASTGRPFSPPIAFRIVPRPNPGKKEKHSIQQGKCHKCAKWVAVEGIKDMESKVSSFYLRKKKPSADGGLVGQRIALVRLPFLRFMKEFGSEFYVFGLYREGGNMRLLVIMIPHSKEKAIIMKLTLFWRSLWRCKRMVVFDCFYSYSYFPCLSSLVPVLYFVLRKLP